MNKEEFLKEHGFPYSSMINWMYYNNYPYNYVNDKEKNRLIELYKTKRLKKYKNGEKYSYKDATQRMYKRFNDMYGVNYQDVLKWCRKRNFKWKGATKETKDRYIYLYKKATNRIQNVV
jgi:hypothetical protein